MRVKSFGVMGLAAVAALAAGGPGVADDKPLTERNQTVESAVATPVEDLNIKKTKIPEVLIRAQANPYDVASAATCDAVAAEVALIDAELGDDYDDLAVAQDADGSKGPSAVGLLKAGVAEAIPFRGLVRQLSGAAGHEKEVEQAIDAGFARRGFLKGRALEMNCAPPASPAWFTPRPQAPAEAVAQAQPAAAAAPVPAPEPVAAAPDPAAVAATPAPPLPEAATTAPAEAAPPPRPAVAVEPLPPIPGASEAAAWPAEPAPQPAFPAAPPVAPAEVVPVP
jgi:hypothetical protein